MSDFLNLAKKRFSVRSFADKTVEQEKVDKIIEAAMTAPTAVNNQPFKIWMLQSDEARENLKQVTKLAYVQTAPVVFVLGGNPEQSWRRRFDGKSFVDIDASIVGAHMILEVCDLGLSTTWVGHFDVNKMKELYPEMADYELVAMYPVGYAAEDVVPGDTHSQSKTKEELVVEL